MCCRSEHLQGYQILHFLYFFLLEKITQCQAAGESLLQLCLDQASSEHDKERGYRFTEAGMHLERQH